MTNRCRILIVLAAIGLILGILRQQPALTLTSMAILILILVAATIFYARITLAWRALICHRVIHHRAIHHRAIQHHDGTATHQASGKLGAVVSTLWVDREYTLSLSIDSGNWRLPAITRIRDIVPDCLQRIASADPGTSALDRSEIWLSSDRDLVEMVYPVRPLAAGFAKFPGIMFQFHDPQGLFVWDRVYRNSSRFRILPGHVNAGDMRPTIKRTNALPQHGIHPLRRAGFGGDLLELREYQPGDPPKSIAWKISARREHLMTRQYESEVPVRLTLLVDQSSSLYFGPPGHRYIDQINYAVASIAKAAVAVGDSVGLIMTGVGQERRFRPSSGDRAFYQILEILADSTQSPRPARGSYKPELLDSAIALCNEHYPEWLDEKINDAYVTFLRLRPSSRRRLRDRLKLTNVITEYYSLGINQTAAMRDDDEVLAKYLRRFLSDHGKAWVPPLAELAHRRSTRDELVTSGSSMARQLNLSIAHSHDNEVYVLIAQLFDLVPGYEDVKLQDESDYPLLEQLIPAIKVAVGRHHRVVVLSPSSAVRTAGASRADKPLNDSADVLMRAERIRLERHSQAISRRLRSIGANFALLGQPDVLPIVMSEAELAGSGRFTRRSYR